MKFLIHLLIAFSIILVFNAHATAQNYGKIEGVLKDSITQEGLIGASIYIYKSDKKYSILGASTDFEGQFQTDSLAYGIYDVEFFYLGYTPKWIFNVVLNADYIRINVGLSENKGLIDKIYEITTFCPQLVPLEKTTQGRIYEAEDIQRSPIKW